MYLGVLDAHGEVPSFLLPMPHLPGCRVGDKERETLERDAALEQALADSQENEQRLLERLARTERLLREMPAG